MADADDSLALRAAWLHFVAGMTQSAVAKRLGLPSVKAHRLIAKAVADGAVKVTIDGDITECIDLENRLADLYGLDYCEVAPDRGRTRYWRGRPAADGAWPCGREFHAPRNRTWRS